MGKRIAFDDIDSAVGQVERKPLRDVERSAQFGQPTGAFGRAIRSDFVHFGTGIGTIRFRLSSRTRHYGANLG